MAGSGAPRRLVGSARSQRTGIGDLTRVRASTWRSTAVVLAAYLLVLQATLAGLTIGATAAPSDVFGQVICATQGANTPDAPGQAPHKASCCMIGCAMFGPGVAPPPDAVRLTDADLVERSVGAPPSTPTLRRAVDRTPRNSRAPPRNV